MTVYTRRRPEVLSKVPFCRIILNLTYGPNDCRNPTKSAGPFGITEYLPDQRLGGVSLTDFGSLDLLPVWNQTKHGAPSPPTHQVVRSERTVGVKTFDAALVKARWE